MGCVWWLDGKHTAVTGVRVSRTVCNYSTFGAFDDFFPSHSPTAALWTYFSFPIFFGYIYIFHFSTLHPSPLLLLVRSLILYLPIQTIVRCTTLLVLFPVAMLKKHHLLNNVSRVTCARYYTHSYNTTTTVVRDVGTSFSC